MWQFDAGGERGRIKTVNLDGAVPARDPRDPRDPGTEP